MPPKGPTKGKASGAGKKGRPKRQGDGNRVAKRSRRVRPISNRISRAQLMIRKIREYSDALQSIYNAREPLTTILMTTVFTMTYFAMLSARNLLSVLSVLVVNMIVLPRTRFQHT